MKTKRVNAGLKSPAELAQRFNPPKPIPEDIGQYFEYRDGHLYRIKLTSSYDRAEIGARIDTIGSNKRTLLTFRGKKYLAHRVIYFIHTGEQPQEIDHINGDISDNRIENLRSATRSQNMQNRVIAKSSVALRGVHWNARDKAWYSRIKLDGKLYELGYYKVLLDAAAARISAENTMFGKYSFLARPK